VMIMIFGICGALLFLWGETDKDEFEVVNASTTAQEIESQIEVLDYNYTQDRDRVQRQIDYYMALDLVRKEVKPREAKLEKMRTDYQQRRDDLTAQLKTAREETGKFRPTAFLSAIIAGSLWKRIVVITILAILLSSTIDLSQYTITTISVSRAYAAGMIYDGENGELNIYNIYNALIGKEKVTQNGNEVTEKVTPEVTVESRPETQENNGTGDSNGKLIKNNVTLTDTQSKILDIVQGLINDGYGLGEINKAEVARQAGCVRETVSRFWDELITKYITMPTNGKYQEEHA